MYVAMIKLAPEKDLLTTDFDIKYRQIWFEFNVHTAGNPV